MTYWFSSDPHYGHKNIIKHANRPFPSIEVMDQELIRRWNSRVKPSDEAFILGDLCFGDHHRAREILYQLNGRKHLIEGNHDKNIHRLSKEFGWISQNHQLKIPDPDAPDGVQRIFLSHYAHKVWNKSHLGSWNLYGHSHGNLEDDPYCLGIDVGVDCWDYYPVSYEEIKAVMKRKHFVPVDHHVGEYGEFRAPPKYRFSAGRRHFLADSIPGLSWEILKGLING